MGEGPGTNTGHGHVWERPDGVKARCGGPAICAECAKDAARYGVLDPLARPNLGLATTEELLAEIRVRIEGNPYWKSDKVELAEEDLIFTPLYAPGQPVNQGPRGIELTHLPTGLTVTSVDGKSQLENKQIVIQMLRVKLRERDKDG